MSLLLLCTLALPALAQDAPPPAEEPPPAEGEEGVASAPERGAVEARLALVLPLGQLGPGVGLDLSASFALGPWLSVGPAFIGQLGSSASGELDDDDVASFVPWSSGLSLVAGAARAEAWLGPRDKLHGRLGLDLGLAGERLRTTGPAGDTVDAGLAPWFALRGGVLIPAGPGQVTVDLGAQMAPLELLVDLDSPAVTLGAGYRLPW